MKVSVFNSDSNSKLSPKFSYNDIPIIEWSSTENRKKLIKSYAIIMFDPNSVVPNWIHLYIPYVHPDLNILTINDKYNKSKTVICKNSRGIFGYSKPAPPYGTHCYIFIVIGLNCVFNKNNCSNDAKEFINLIYTNKNVVDINSVTFYYNKENKNNNQAVTGCNIYKYNTIGKLYEHFYPKSKN